MEAVFLTPEMVLTWNKFASESDDAWLYQTTDWWNWAIALNRKVFIENLSFFIYGDDRILAICPLMIEHADSGPEFSLLGEPMPFPALHNSLDQESRQEVLTYYFEKLSEIAQEKGVSYVSLKVPAQSRTSCKASSFCPNPMIRFGYTDLSYQTQMINLKSEADSLLSEMRKGHRADIKRAQKKCEAHVWGKDDVSLDVFIQYQALHAKDAGRVTRSQKTFDMMYEWIKDGKAILVGATFEGRPAAFALITIFKDGAYYGSGCRDPEITLPVSHLVQWEAIIWLKAHDFIAYEIGLQWFGPQWFCVPTEKEISISHFKRGFGGQTVSQITGEYFFSTDLMKEVYRKRIEAYSYARESSSS